LGALFSNTLNICPTLKAASQGLHIYAYKIIDKITLIIHVVAEISAPKFMEQIFMFVVVVYIFVVLVAL
jgi:hypothetical protein